MKLFRRIRTKTHVVIFSVVVMVLADILAAGLSSIVMDYNQFINSLPTNLLIGSAVSILMASFVGLQLAKINFLNGEMDRLASFDYLTGGETRRKFFGHFKKDNSLTGAIIAMDIRGLKQINDTFGHAAGDQALIKMAGTILGLIGKKDHLCRMGGDEFCVFLDGVDQLTVNRIANRIKQKLAEENVGDNKNYPKLEASFGIAMFEKGDDIEDVISTADRALIEQKSKSRIPWQQAIL